MIRIAMILAVAWLAFAASGAPAGVINVQFGLTGDSPLYVGTAAAPDSGTVWNELRGPATASIGPYSSGALVDSQTGTSSVTYTIGGATSGNSVAFDDLVSNEGFAQADYSNTGAPNLTRSQAYAPVSQTGEILLSGLTPTSTYSLYVYSDRGSPPPGILPAPNTTNFTVFDGTHPLGASLISGVNLASTSGFNTPEDYVLFTGLTPTTIAAANQIEIKFTQATNGYGALNGFQLVETTVLTPEPASLVLFGLGALSLLWVVRQRRNG